MESGRERCPSYSLPVLNNATATALGACTVAFPVSALVFQSAEIAGIGHGDAAAVIPTSPFRITTP